MRVDNDGIMMMLLVMVIVTIHVDDADDDVTDGDEGWLQ